MEECRTISQVGDLDGDFLFQPVVQHGDARRIGHDVDDGT